MLRNTLHVLDWKRTPNCHRHTQFYLHWHSKSHWTPGFAYLTQLPQWEANIWLHTLTYALKHTEHYFVLTGRDESHHSQSCQISQMVSNLARANLCAAQHTSPWQGSQSSSSEIKTTSWLGQKSPELVWLKNYSRVTSVAVIAAILPVSFDCGFSMNADFLLST